MVEQTQHELPNAEPASAEVTAAVIQRQQLESTPVEAAEDEPHPVVEIQPELMQVVSPRAESLPAEPEAVQNGELHPEPRVPEGQVIAQVVQAERLREIAEKPQTAQEAVWSDEQAVQPALVAAEVPLEHAQVAGVVQPRPGPESDPEAAPLLASETPGATLEPLSLDVQDLPGALEIHEQLLASQEQPADLAEPGAPDEGALNTLVDDAEQEEAFDWRSLLYPENSTDIDEPAIEVPPWAGVFITEVPEAEEVPQNVIEHDLIAEDAVLDDADVPKSRSVETNEENTFATLLANAKSREVVPSPPEAEIIPVLEKLSDVIEMLPPEEQEVVYRPVEQALEAVAELRQDDEIPQRELEAAEEHLIENLQELFEVLGLKPAENEVENLAQHLMRQDVLFDTFGTREGWRYGLQALKKQQVPRHSLIGKAILLFYSLKQQSTKRAQFAA